MFQIAHHHLVWFTGLICDELSAANQSAFKVQNRLTKENTKKVPSTFFTSSHYSISTVPCTPVCLFLICPVLLDPRHPDLPVPPCHSLCLRVKSQQEKVFTHTLNMTVLSSRYYYAVMLLVKQRGVI